jgi:hypothetical protein
MEKIAAGIVIAVASFLARDLYGWIKKRARRQESQISLVPMAAENQNLALLRVENHGERAFIKVRMRAIIQDDEPAFVMPEPRVRWIGDAASPNALEPHRIGQAIIFGMSADGKQLVFHWEDGTKSEIEKSAVRRIRCLLRVEADPDVRDAPYIACDYLLGGDGSLAIASPVYKKVNDPMEYQQSKGEGRADPGGTAVVRKEVLSFLAGLASGVLIMVAGQFSQPLFGRWGGHLADQVAFGGAGLRAGVNFQDDDGLYVQIENDGNRTAAILRMTVCQMNEGWFEQVRNPEEKLTIGNPLTNDSTEGQIFQHLAYEASDDWRTRCGDSGERLALLSEDSELPPGGTQAFRFEAPSEVELSRWRKGQNDRCGYFIEVDETSAARAGAPRGFVSEWTWCRAKKRTP